MAPSPLTSSWLSIASRSTASTSTPPLPTSNETPPVDAEFVAAATGDDECDECAALARPSSASPSTPSRYCFSSTRLC
jgi:hypothetical protein